METVKNEYGTEFDFGVAVQLMDDDVREEIHREIAPCGAQEFFDAYLKRHEERFGEEWILAQPNPQI